MSGNYQSSQTKIKHPGEKIKSLLEEQGMSQKELALRTGVSDKHISTVLSGEKGISVSFARKLAVVFEKDYRYWTKLQAEYENHLLNIEEENNIKPEEKELLKPLKEIFGYLVKEEMLHNDCSDAEKVLQLRKFLCVTDLTAALKITYNAAYRAQLKSNSAVDVSVLFVWQRLCEKITEKIRVADKLNTELLYSKIGDIKLLMSSDDPDYFCKQLEDIFAECGIAFGVVRHFKGAPVQGFIKKTENGRNILCLTIRNGRADSFWFTLFHEIGHLVHGDLSMRFVDFSSVKGEIEDEADKFAQDAIIASQLFDSFVNKRDYRDLTEIQNFAKKAGVPVFMVIGRLQKLGLLDWSAHSGLIPKFKWVEE